MLLFSYCKVNLGLKINELRSDGFHSVEMITQNLNLFDVIDVSLNNNGKTNVTCNINCSPENNLAYIASEKFFSYMKIKKGISIKISKKIPDGAGLGGGSSNAAAILIGLNKMFDTNLSSEDLMKISESIGSDVPMFITGGTIKCEGRGEIITKLPDIPKCKFLLEVKNTKNYTKDSYKKFDEYKNKVQFNPNRFSYLEKYIKYGNINDISSGCFNDFEVVYPVDFGWHLTGSGSCCFKIVDENFKVNDKNLIVCHPVNFGVKIIENFGN